MSLSVGDILDDRYELVQRLGQGGQGEVWRAVDRLPPNPHVALKLIALARTPESGLERLRREAAALHELSHPSLISCRRAFEDLSRKLFGLVLEYFEGGTVDEALCDERFTPEMRTWVLRHLAHALSYLHERGVVHRDLKPENVLLGAGFWREPERPEHLKLIDLGIAARAGNPRPVTDVGRVIGTAPYMAPEVIDPTMFRGEVTGASRDVFAYGILGWVLLAGNHPSGVECGDLPDYAHAYRAAVQGAEAWPRGEVAGGWGRLLKQCFALRAEARPASGREIAQVVEGFPVGAPSSVTSHTELGVPLGAGTGTQAAAPLGAGTGTRAAAPLEAGTGTRAAAPLGVEAGGQDRLSGPAPAVGAPSIPVPPAPSVERKGGSPVVYLLAGAVIALLAVVLAPRLVSQADTAAAPPRAPEAPARAVEAPADSAAPAASVRGEAPPVETAVEAPAPELSGPPPVAPPPAAPIPDRKLKDNPFAAACCAETECELSSKADAYFSRWASQVSEGTCLCPSQNKLLGCCERRIPRGATWSLRLSNVLENDPSPRLRNVLDLFPDADVCVKRSADGDKAYRCKPLVDTKDPRGVSMGVRATTEDLEITGLDIAIFSDGSHGKYVAWRNGAVPRDRPIGPVTLCIGLRYITGFTSMSLVDPSVSFFLDPVP